VAQFCIKLNHVKILQPSGTLTWTYWSWILGQVMPGMSKSEIPFEKKYNYEMNIYFQAFTASIAQLIVFWAITPCRIICLFRRFGGTCYLHLQGDRLRFRGMLKWEKKMCRLYRSSAMTVANHNCGKERAERSCSDARGMESMKCGILFRPENGCEDWSSTFVQIVRTNLST
jgi:hypothetical protein